MRAAFPTSSAARSSSPMSSRSQVSRSVAAYSERIWGTMRPGLSSGPNGKLKSTRTGSSARAAERRASSTLSSLNPSSPSFLQKRCTLAMDAFAARASSLMEVDWMRSPMASTVRAICCSAGVRSRAVRMRRSRSMGAPVLSRPSGSQECRNQVSKRIIYRVNQRIQDEKKSRIRAFRLRAGDAAGILEPSGEAPAGRRAACGVARRSGPGRTGGGRGPAGGAARGGGSRRRGRGERRPMGRAHRPSR